MKNTNLHAAKAAKNDEFYTQRVDIENELRHYRDFFNGKIVYCNCDDAFESEFVQYFCHLFRRLGLKKLIATCYAGSAIAERRASGGAPGAYKLEVAEPFYDANGDGGIDRTDFELIIREKGLITPLAGDGDFRSPECLALLDEADIVVTNPPFSLFREFVATLIEHRKQFVIVGNMNAITYKEIFPLIKDNQLWLGYHSPKEFVDPSGDVKKFGNILWYTNLPIEKRTESLVRDLYQRFDSGSYPMYDNYCAWNVDRVCDIPVDTAFVVTVGEEEYRRLQACYGADCVLVEVIDDEEV